jgi:hypothetical protein
VPTNGIPLGVYEHFSGNRYRVIGIGHSVLGVGDSETVGDAVVVYQALFDSARYGHNHIWVRQVDNFTEEVQAGGRVVPRFRFLGQDNDA